MKIITKISMLSLIALLAIDCKKEDSKSLPTACFEFTSTSIDNGDDASAGEQIVFTNCSENADSYKWDFGDDETSTSKNPKHTFAESGSYTITLEATNGDGTKTTTQDIEVISSLSGEWIGTLTIEGELEVYTFDLAFNLEQSGQSLSGDYDVNNGEMSGNISTQSKIIGQDVTIKFTYSTADGSYAFVMTGEANASLNSMGGRYTLNGIEAGDWSVDNVSSKSSKNPVINLKSDRKSSVKDALKKLN
jgi:PKD repeat protein